ncbi:DUF2170 family protein [Dyella ginsengisoli]|uniref:DUF2170 family protein n=1 Tax=Dyella ginsengisoli TaxID=363848 RepID=UPI000348EF0C|nr:DUF2170 family protein [Dyella ginsengisoli]
MTNRKAPSAGAARQKAFRERMSGLGMTIPRIYMTEDEQGMVREFLRRARGEHTEQLVAGMDFASMHEKWSAPRLCEALAVHAGHHGELREVHLQGLPPAIGLSLARYGNLPARLTVGDEEIFATTVLCTKDAVKHAARFNEACLRLGPTLPLSNVGLVGDDYILFGQLSAHAPLANIVEELDVLGRNAVKANEELADLIRFQG